MKKLKIGIIGVVVWVTSMPGNIANRVPGSSW